MTIYELSIISTTGFPYYNKVIKPVPEGVKIFLRFFDFSKDRFIVHEQLDSESKFDLTAGLISELLEFARNIDKKIERLEFKVKKTTERMAARILYLFFMVNGCLEIFFCGIEEFFSQYLG